MKDTPYTALLAAFLCLVDTLEKRGVLSVADLVTSVGNTLDYRNGLPDAEAGDNLNLQDFYELLQTMEKQSVQLASLKAQISSDPHT